MATIAFDDDSGAGQGAKPPISLHPAFPAVVALWFAALLGLGSLALPAALIERATMATGLAALLPAATPPLGLTARVLIALAAAALGALGGLVIARQVAGLHAGEREPRADDALTRLVRRPLDIREEFGDDDFAPVAEPPVMRRRPLTMADVGELPEKPSRHLFVSAPADEPAAEAEPDVFEDHWHEPAPDDEPETFAEIPDEPAPAPETLACDEDREMTQMPEFSAPFSGAANEDPEPLPFAPPSLARRAAPEAPAAQAAFSGDWSDVPLDSLGLVQLVERLGAALERRRAQSGVAQPAFVPTPVPAPALPTGFDVAAPEEAAQAMASYFGRPAAVPAPEFAPPPPVAAPRPDLMQRFGAMLGGADDEEDEGEDWLAGFSLPMRKPALPVAGAMAEVPDDEDGDDDDRCGSLLAMSAAAAVRKSAEVVRFEDAAAAQRRFAPPEPASEPAPEQVFEQAFEPAQPQLSSADTAAALRAALASLQSVRDSA